MRCARPSRSTNVVPSSSRSTSTSGPARSTNRRCARSSTATTTSGAQLVFDRGREAQRAGAIDAERPAIDITDVLVAFVDGLGLQGLVYPELLTKERIDLLLDAQLVALGADADQFARVEIPEVEPSST